MRDDAFASAGLLMVECKMMYVVILAVLLVPTAAHDARIRDAVSAPKGQICYTRDRRT